MHRTLRLFEHSRLHVGSDGISAREFDAIVQFNDRHDGQFFDIGHKHIRAKHFVGYVEVGEVSIEILPKADRNETSSHEVWSSGLLEMLRVALGLRLDQLPNASQKAARARLLDLIAQAFVSELEPLLHEGLAKGYRTTSSNGTVFRGRLKMADHLRDNVAHADRFFVEYETFDQDILVNRVLVAALDALSWCALSEHAGRSVEGALARFPDLQHRAVTPQTLERIRLTRSTQRYSSALTYARLILSQQGPQLRTGRERVFALLFDMNALWEQYIAVLLRRVAPATLQVSTQERHVFWSPSLRSSRKIRPDIVVRSIDGHEARKALLVIDTKWKVPSNGLPSDEDLKQMFVYNELLSGPRSLLLYPRTAKSLPSSGAYAKREHTCEQAHIGLLAGEKWSTPSIKEQLRALVEHLG
jgi:5-methylcytosine-specific restriction enzyme subunit McrC